MPQTPAQDGIVDPLEQLEGSEKSTEQTDGKDRVSDVVFRAKGCPLFGEDQRDQERNGVAGAIGEQPTYTR